MRSRGVYGGYGVKFGRCGVRRILRSRILFWFVTALLVLSVTAWGWTHLFPVNVEWQRGSWTVRGNFCKGQLYCKFEFVVMQCGLQGL